MSLNISETFYSVQGEGYTTGVPSIFIRLQNCNLMSIGVKPGRRNPKIWTPKGKISITDIKPDDIVLAVDDNNNLVETKVKAVFNYEIEDHYEISLEGKPIIFCSGDHPWLTNKGWKQTRDLDTTDEIMHFTSKDHRSFMMSGVKNPMKNRDTVEKRLDSVDYEEIGRKISKTRLKLFEEGKLKTIMDNLKEKGVYDDFIVSLSKRMTLNNPMFNPETVKKSTAAHNQTRYKDTIYMSKTEHDFHKLCLDMGLPVQYVGNFDHPVKVKDSNRNIYPDFIVEGTNRVIETYWSKGRWSNRDDEWVEIRKKLFEDAGYSVTFVDFSTLNKTDMKNLLESDIRPHNGIKVKGVKFIKHKRQYVSQDRHKLNCYDLTCYPHHSYLVEGMVTHNCGGPGGSLMKQGKATWWCDSETVWRGGKPYTNEELEQKFIEFGQLENVLAGTTHLIWTGGEPTIPASAQGIRDFLDYMKEKYPINTIYSEIETNGSLELIGNCKDLYTKPGYINQINCSAKLANSGMGKALRINPKAIEQIKQHPNYWFKIVVSTEEDIQETFTDYIEKFGIPKSKLIIMPGVDNREDLPERTLFVYEMAKKYNVRACTRVHVLCWDRVTGV